MKFKEFMLNPDAEWPQDKKSLMGDRQHLQKLKPQYNAQPVLFYYRATSGKEIPWVSDKSLDELIDEFKDSVTPITRIVPPEDIENELDTIEQLQREAPEDETGLRHSYKVVLKRFGRDFLQDS
jgi:hypothetical protein